MADETDAVEQQVEEGQKACDFALEIDGQRVDGILAVRGLVAFRLDVRTTTAIRKLQEPFKVTRMVQPDPQHPCDVWVNETFGAGEDIVRPARTLTLLALEGVRSCGAGPCATPGSRKWAIRTSTASPRTCWKRR